jgi:hypothetical protein
VNHHYAEPDPQPAPLTAIGWRLTHVAMCKVLCHEHAYGPRAVTWLTRDARERRRARRALRDLYRVSRTGPDPTAG